MNFRKKALTKDCKKCSLKTNNDGDSPDVCGFGNSTATKLLVKKPGKIRKCNLINKE